MLLTITLTQRAAKHFQLLLRNNKIVYGVCRTTYTLENSPKVRMAIADIKGNYGTSSIIVKQS